MNMFGERPCQASKALNLEFSPEVPRAEKHRGSLPGVGTFDTLLDRFSTHKGASQRVDLMKIQAYHGRFVISRSAVRIEAPAPIGIFDE